MNRYESLYRALSRLIWACTAVSIVCGVALILSMLICSKAHAAPGSENGGHFFLSPDNWGGRDAHQGVSALIGAGVNFHFKDSKSWGTKYLYCIAPGAAKETLDWLGGSGFSRNDMISNSLGCLGGFAISEGLIRFTPKPGGGIVTYQREL